VRGRVFAASSFLPSPSQQRAEEQAEEDEEEQGVEQHVEIEAHLFLLLVRADGDGPARES
jgi:hypothetical protein